MYFQNSEHFIWAALLSIGMAIFVHCNSNSLVRHWSFQSCLIMNFEKIQPARPYYLLHVYQFKKNFQLAWLLPSARLLGTLELVIYKPSSSHLQVVCKSLSSNLIYVSHTAVFFDLLIILNSRHISQPFTFVHFSNLPIVSFGENK